MKKKLSKSLYSLVSFGCGMLIGLGILSSCSDYTDSVDAPESPDGSNVYDSKEPGVLESTPLSFATIRELESLDPATISEDLAGYELQSLEYECVDTIEMRALLLDVTAKLRSATSQEKTVTFSAEVGPELLSVEYYPGGEIVPVHHNMIHAFHPKVERYRNYSDGSRIGPDTFYDYGHQVIATTYYRAWPSDIYDGIMTLKDHMIPDWDGMNINQECEYYSDGVYYTYNKSEIECNLNATVIGENGKIYHGEDFLPIYNEPVVESFYRFQDLLIYLINDPDAYYSTYFPEILYDMDDEVTNFALNLCRDVEDQSPCPFTTDTHELSPGWYWTGGQSTRYAYSRYVSTYIYDLFSEEIFDDGPDIGFSFDWGWNTMMQYMVIDGRIINFYGLMKDYGGLGNAKETTNITKVSDGYMINCEVETVLYGEKFKALYDVHIKTVNGPEVLINRSNYNSIDKNDQEEVDNITGNDRRSRSGYETEYRIPRGDGKFIDLATDLPKSISGIKKVGQLKK